MSEDEDFYATYLAPLENRLLRTAWRIVRDPDRARDALQDTLMQVWRRRDRVRAHPRPEALILRICIHASLDRLRKDTRPEAPLEPEQLAETSAGDAAAEVRRAEIEAHVLTAIAGLPPKQAAAVLMRVLEEKEYAAIGQALGCSQVTARIHVMRGRAALGRRLAALLGTPLRSRR